MGAWLSRGDGPLIDEREASAVQRVTRPFCVNGGCEGGACKSWNVDALKHFGDHALFNLLEGRASVVHLYGGRLRFLRPNRRRQKGKKKGSGKASHGYLHWLTDHYTAIPTAGKRACAMLPRATLDFI